MSNSSTSAIKFSSLSSARRSWKNAVSFISGHGVSASMAVYGMCAVILSSAPCSMAMSCHWLPDWNTRQAGTSAGGASSFEVSLPVNRVSRSSMLPVGSGSGATWVLTVWSGG